MSERVCDHDECCRYYLCAHPKCCGYDRSAGRWCDECGMHGSHHTDRHVESVFPEMTKAAPAGTGAALTPRSSAKRCVVRHSVIKATSDSIHGEQHE